MGAERVGGSLGSMQLPDGIAFKLPANSRVVLQVHYHPHGVAPQPDKTEIGVYYARTPPTKLLRIVPLINTTFTIPPGALVYSDPVSLAIPQTADVAIDLYLPGTTNTSAPLTMHTTAVPGTTGSPLHTAATASAPAGSAMIPSRW